jgi:hypothetical protein
MEDVDYISVEEAAQILRVSVRHAHRACHKANVRTTKAGKRTLYHKIDVERLAVELGAAYRHVEPPGEAAAAAEPSTALVPYDTLQRQLADVQTELAELKRMVVFLVEQSAKQEAPAAPPEQPAPPEPTPAQRPWFMRLFDDYRKSSKQRRK